MTTTTLDRPRRIALPRVLSRGWETAGYLGLLVVSAVLYVWDLASSGWANAFYSAAVQAGTQNWVSFFYGSSDAGNSITVDKPPASLWLMEISARIFGLSSWSILLPEAILGVVTVALVYAIVRRNFTAPAALIAGAATALTPVAVLMFRFNNPDALLVALCTAAVYFTLRGIEDGRIRWILWTGAMLGFAFLTKQLQGWLIVPVLGLVYLYASPRSIGTRLLHLAAGLGAIVVSAGWWVAVVELVPANLRPYIGGSQNNDFLQLTFGYNGFGRLTGNETGSVTGGRGGGAGAWGETGITRLFGTEFGGQISWLLPAALVLLVVGIVVLRRRPRVDGARATMLLLGGSMLITGLAFSFGAGIIHPYYSVALAPFIGGLVGAGSALLWQRRDALWARIVAAATVLITTYWSFTLLSQSTDFVPWLRWVVVLAGLVGAAALLTSTLLRALGGIAIAGALVAGLAGPAAYAVDTTLTAHTGSIPSAGPAVAGGRGFGGGGMNGFAGRRFGGQFGGGTGTQGGFGGGQGGAQGGFGGGTRGGFGGQGGTQAGGTQTQGGFGGGTQARGFGGGGGGGGGLLGGSTDVSSALVTALKSGSYTWAAAAVGSQNAASYQLASGESVMPIGGFNGSDPSPTLAQFKADVAAGKIHYFIASGRGGFGGSNGGSSDSSEITSWVESTFTSSTIGGVTVYDLTTSTSGTNA